MLRMPSNTAAWLTAAKANHLEAKSAPYTSPRENEIVIKNGAVAINPADWLKQDMGDLMFSWIKYPFIVGSDVAGEVVEIGSAVSRFKVGDRVLGHAVGISEKRNSSAEGAFQTYTVLLAHMASPIPSTLSYESAAVLPLGVSTAACGLFQKDQLALQYPSVPPKPTGKTLLVWGGATSVGSNAIQLAVAAGYEVITTASPRNFDYVKKLGASQVFDYNSETIVDNLIHAFKGKTIAGALSIGHGAAEACLDILDKCEGDKFISMATYPVLQPPPKHFVFLSTALYFVSWIISNWFKSRARHIRTKFIFGSTLVDNGVGKVVYVDFLPKALAEGIYIAAPDPQVVGKGLEYIQAGFDLQKKGVSAKKVVVSL
jgi:NADPH:quinone reductase-like Zn-dependent oxidoreductase